MDVLYGIDLGTTYSCVAYLTEVGKVESIKNSEGVLTTPSVIYFSSENSQTVGEEAKDYAITEPEKSVSFIKREMGTDYTRKIDGKEYTPQELSAIILKKLVQDANNTLIEQGVLESGNEVKKVVITCPAYFGMAEKEATKAAGEIAGLEVLDIINEPTAAAIHYGQMKGDHSPKRVLVYDLGGGTFDVTIMDIKENDVDVLCTGGDAKLGGKDWDEATVKYLLEKWQEENDSSEDITANLDTKSAMLSAAEKAKKSLSSKDKVKVNFNHDGEPFRTELTREEFDEYTSSLLTKTIQMTDACIDSLKSKDNSKEIDEIILVGGSSRMPQIKKKIEETYHKPVSMFDPDEAVAKGAAIYAHNVKEKTGDIPGPNGPGIRISNVSSRTYGIKCITDDDQEMISNIIYQNAKLPITDEKEYSTHSDNQSGLTLDLYETTANEDITDRKEVERLKPVASFDMKFKTRVPKNTPLLVKMTLNNSGLLSISAVELLNNSTLDVEYKIGGGLSKTQIAEKRKQLSDSTIE